LHKAFLRYHDADNWPALREALARMGRRDLIGPAKHQLVPTHQPVGWQPKRGPMGKQGDRKVVPRKGMTLTQHTGLPPRRQTETRPPRGQKPKARPSR
jgi:hypothetical protein